MDTTITTTNSATGAITQVTIMQPQPHYLRLALAFAAFCLLAWGLRKLFWQKDSN
jgi:hypothetical protein